MKQFSEYLKEKRGRLSADQAACDVGISRATWNRIERGFPPDILTLIKLNHTYGDGYDLLMALYIQDFVPDTLAVQEDRTHAAAQ